MAPPNQITANVHSMDANSNICIITIRDGNELIIDNSNIGMESNEDGSANTVWLRDKISSYVAGHRAAKARKDNAVIHIDIGEPIV
jgi:predicted transcriptional regulator